MRVNLTSALVIAAVSVAAAFGGERGVAPQQGPDRLTALQREADALARQERTLLTELRQLEVERDLKVEEVRRAEADLAVVALQRVDAAVRIAELEGRIATETPGLSARLVELYKLGRPGYLRLLFDVDSLQAATRGYRTVSALVDADRRRVAEFRQTLDDLHRSERTLGERSARIQALETQAQGARQAAERAVARHGALIAQIDARRDLNAQLMGELQAARSKLAALAPAADRAAAVAPTSSVSLARLRGSLDWPAAGRLAARFGAQRDGRFGTTTMRAGVEISAAAGSPAAAIQDGVVAYAEPFAGFGNLVIVDHGHQAYSLYGYLDSLSVTRGTRVARGQAVGRVGRTPEGKTGLYFELRIDGKAVDPVQWLKKQQGP
jgi:septal ring factor EnvC (AmiA/AmiB activator)